MTCSPNLTESSSQQNEVRNIENGNGSTTQEGLSKFIKTLSDEMNARFSQEMGSIMDLMQSQSNRAISSAIFDRVIPEIQNIMYGSLPLNRNVPEPCTSLTEYGIGNAWKTQTQNLQRRTQGLVISEKILYFLQVVFHLSRYWLIEFKNFQNSSIYYHVMIFPNRSFVVFFVFFLRNHKHESLFSKHCSAIIKII